MVLDASHTGHSSRLGAVAEDGIGDDAAAEESTRGEGLKEPAGKGDVHTTGTIQVVSDVDESVTVLPTPDAAE